MKLKGTVFLLWKATVSPHNRLIAVYANDENAKAYVRSKCAKSISDRECYYTIEAKKVI